MLIPILNFSRHPDELYINGIQRASFIPAIDLIKERFEVVDLDSETGQLRLCPHYQYLAHFSFLDYRKIPRALSHTYYHPLDQSTSEMSKLFESLTSSDPISTDVVSNRKIPLWGRHLTVPESSGSIARFTFTDLCDMPLSAADYLEVTQTFETVFVEGIPRMGLSERDQARRFITFIDGEHIQIWSCRD